MLYLDMSIFLQQLLKEIDTLKQNIDVVHEIEAKQFHKKYNSDIDSQR